MSYRNDVPSGGRMVTRDWQACQQTRNKIMEQNWKLARVEVLRRICKSPFLGKATRNAALWELRDLETELSLEISYRKGYNHCDP